MISPLAAARVNADSISQKLIIEERKLDYLEDSAKQQQPIQFLSFKKKD